MTIQKDGEEPVYFGSDPPSGGFQVEIQQSGAYQIAVTGEHAQGCAAFSVVPAATEESKWEQDMDRLSPCISPVKIETHWQTVES